MKKHITIIGLGLIGGSIGLALKNTAPADWEITGYDRNPRTLRKALVQGAIDKEQRILQIAVADADIVIIATPVMSIRNIMSEIGSHLSPGCIVSDTGSTKTFVMQWAEQYLPNTISFIGGHPMAGKEQRGIEASDANLFRGRTYCLTRGPQSNPTTVRKMLTIIKQIGAKPYLLDAPQHDWLVAGISHMPHLVSRAIMATTTESPSWPAMSKLAATGYKDITRLASGDARMMSDICRTNGENIHIWIEDFISLLRKYCVEIEENDITLEETFSRVKGTRENWLREDK